MAHKSAMELKELLEEGRVRVAVGGKYVHYKEKTKEYTVTDLVILEHSEEVGVVYRAEYEELRGIIFVRPLSEFLGEVKNESGGSEKRFSQVV